VARTESACTPANYQRLRQVKRAWDPDNVFGLNHNIPPATGQHMSSTAGPLAAGK
jgi:hypothetical protein